MIRFLRQLGCLIFNHEFHVGRPRNSVVSQYVCRRCGVIAVFGER